MKKKRKWIWAVAAVLVLVLLLRIVFGGHSNGRFMIDTQVVVCDSVVSEVTATGVVQPVYKVTVGTQVSGIVKHLYADYNDKVRRGDLLAELDKSLLQEELNVSRAQLSVATSQKNLAQKNFDRVKQLFEQQAATQQEYDQAEAELDQSSNQLVTAKANYGNAVTNLTYAEIYSPIDGIIISRQVEEGQTVQGAYSVPDLFTIAKNMTEIQVEAKVDEADIGKVQVGQSVTFKVDAFPNDPFQGMVKQIRMEPQINNNVVTYIVIITAENPEEKLFPGMTANVKIIVAKGSGLVVPSYGTQLSVDSAMLARDGYKVVPVSHKSESANYLWLKEGKTFRQVEVVLGVKDKIRAVALEGVHEGDTVISSLVDVTKQQQERSDDGPF
jgi:HlyD family secretion protein